MRIFAYCTALAREAVAAATGVEPLTSPPTTAADFDPQWLAGYDLLYFRLHAIPGVCGWFGEGPDKWFHMALAERHIEAANLGGAICVVANCYGADDDPMVAALHHAGAAAVIAGEGKNMAAAARVVGTDLLVQWLIRLLRLRMTVERALAVTKVRLGLTAWRRSDRDAMTFRIIKEERSGQAEIV